MKAPLKIQGGKKAAWFMLDVCPSKNIEFFSFLVPLALHQCYSYGRAHIKLKHHVGNFDRNGPWMVSFLPREQKHTVQ